MSEAKYLNTLRLEMRDELASIADWWLEHVVCLESGTIRGEISNDNRPDLQADKSLVYVTRLLWFFSAAFRFQPAPGPAATLPGSGQRTIGGSGRLGLPHLPSL